MRPPESFIGQPIRSLQTMLRLIAEHDADYIPIIPDGIYGPETVRAVTVFQRSHGLPATGITDLATWEAIVDAYDHAQVHQREAEPLHIILDPSQVIRKGEQHPHVHLVQAILHALSEIYECVDQPNHTGILDDNTSDSLAAFQALSGLPMTGHLDKHTWRHLALHYPLAANLSDLL